MQLSKRQPLRLLPRVEPAGLQAGWLHGHASSFTWRSKALSLTRSPWSLMPVNLPAGATRIGRVCTAPTCPVLAGTGTGTKCRSPLRVKEARKLQYGLHQPCGLPQRVTKQVAEHEATR